MTEQQTRPRGPRPGDATAHVAVASVVRTGSGIPVVIEATVTNTGTVASAFTVTAQGVDAAWLPAPVSTPVLAPQQSASVALKIHPAAGTLAAQYPMALTAQATDPSGNGSGAKTVADLVLVVSPRSQITMELSPTSVTAWIEHRTTLLVRNTGAGVADIVLQPVSTGSLRIRLAKDHLQIAPGESAKVRVRTMATRPQFVGITMRHKYRILARGEEAQRHAEGEFVQRPLVAPGWLKVLGIVLVLSVWIGAGVVFIPKLTNIVGNQTPSITTADIAKHVVGGAKAVGGGGSNSGSGKGGGGGGSGDGSGKGSHSSKGSGTQTGGGPAGGQGKAKKPTTVQLNGTVTAKDPSGVKVTLKPTSLVDEAAASGQAKPVGLTGAELAAFNATGKVSPAARVIRTAASEPTTRSVVTGADGAWSFPGVKSPGYYLVQFTKPGYQTYSYVVDSSSADAQNPLPVTMTAGEGTLSGTVKGPDGKPVGGADITITDGTSTITASSNTTGNVGRWQVTGLSTPSSYTVSASKNGMSLESKLVDLPASGSLTVDLTLRAGVATLSGKVLGPDSTGTVTGVGGATVIVSDGQNVTRTATTVTEGDLAGTFTVPSLPAPGDYTVTLSADGFATQTSKIHLKSGQGSLDMGATTLVTSLGTVQGVVKEKLNGTALVGAGLTLTNDTSSYKTTSTSTGDFRINGVTPGTYTLTTQMFGYGDDVATITIDSGGTATVNPVLVVLPNGVLPATASIKGSAVDGTTGKALTACATPATACLTATVIIPGTGDGRRGGSSISANFAEGDSYTLSGLLPGTYTITITAPGFASNAVTVSVGEGQTAVAPVATLYPAPHIQGTITIAQGVPTGNICVFAVSTSNPATPTSCPTSGNADGATGTRCFPTPVSQSSYGITTTNATVLCAYSSGNRYRIDLPADGSWKVFVIPSDPDYVPVGISKNGSGVWVADNPASFTLQNGATQDYSPTMPRNGHLQVTVMEPGAGNILAPSNQPIQVVVTNLDTSTPVGTYTTSGGAVTITGLVPGHYRVSATNPTTSASGTTDAAVSLNGTADVSLPLTSATAPYIGRLLTSIDGGTTRVPLVGATITLTGPVGYALGQTTGTPGTLTLVTDAMGCFAVLSKDSAGHVVLPSGVPTACQGGGLSSDPTVRWADTGTNASPKSAGLPDDGADAFVSNRVDTLSVTVGAGGTDYQTWTPASGSYVFASTDPSTGDVVVNTLLPLLSPNPVSFSGVTMSASDPPSDWSRVGFGISAPGSTAGMTISASGSGTTGTLSFTDPTLSNANTIRPGKYTITASLTGYESDTADLVCYAPNTPATSAGADHTGEIANGSSTCYWQDSHQLKLIKDGSITVQTAPGATVNLSATLTDPSSTPTTGPLTGTSLVNNVATSWVVGVLSGTADSSGTVVFSNLRPSTVRDTTTVYTLSLIAPPGFYNATMGATSDPNTKQVALTCTGALNDTHDDGTITLGVSGAVSCPADLTAVDIVSGGTTTSGSLETGYIRGTVLGYQSSTGDSPSMPVNGIVVQAFYCDAASQTSLATADNSTNTCTKEHPGTADAETTTASFTDPVTHVASDGVFNLTGASQSPIKPGYYELDVSNNAGAGWAKDTYPLTGGIVAGTVNSMIVFVATPPPAVAAVSLPTDTSDPSSTVPITLSLRQVPASVTFKVTRLVSGTPTNVADATVTVENTNNNPDDTCTLAYAGSGSYNCSHNLVPGTYNYSVSGDAYATASGSFDLTSAGVTRNVSLSLFATSFSGAVVTNDGASFATLSGEPNYANPTTGAWVYLCASGDGTAHDCWTNPVVGGVTYSVIKGTDGANVQVHPTSTGSYVLANIPTNKTGEEYYIFARYDADSYASASYGPIQGINSHSSTSNAIPTNITLTAPTRAVSISVRPVDPTDDISGAHVTLAHSGVTTLSYTIAASDCTAGVCTASFPSVPRGTWTESINFTGLSSSHVGTTGVVAGNNGSTLDRSTLTVPATGAFTTNNIAVVEQKITPGYTVDSSVLDAVPGMNVTVSNSAGASTTLPTITPPSRGGTNSGSSVWVGPGTWNLNGSFSSSVAGGSAFFTITSSSVTVTATNASDPATISVAGSPVLSSGTGTATAPTVKVSEVTASAAVTVRVRTPGGTNNGAVLSNMHVHVTDGAGHNYDTYTDSTGIANFDPSTNNGLGYGQWQVWVTDDASKYEQSAQQTIDLRAGVSNSPYDLDFEMSPLAKVNFTVADQKGRGVNNITVSIGTGAVTSGTGSCLTNQSGTCSISNVKYNNSGGWTVTTSADSSAPSGYSTTCTLVSSICTTTLSSAKPVVTSTDDVNESIEIPALTSNVTFTVQAPNSAKLANVVVSLPQAADGTPGSGQSPQSCTTGDGVNPVGAPLALGQCTINNVLYNPGSSAGGVGSAGSAWKASLAAPVGSGYTDPNNVQVTATGSNYGVTATMNVVSSAVTITVHDSSNANASGVVVHVNSPSVSPYTNTCTTDGTGSCLLTSVPFNLGSSYNYGSGQMGAGLAASAWTVSISGTGWATNASAASLTIPSTGTPQTLGPITATLVTSNVQFTVTDDATTPNPLGGVSVKLSSPGAPTCTTVSVTTGSDGPGQCTIANVPYNQANSGGAWDVTLSKDGYDAASGGSAPKVTISDHDGDGDGLIDVTSSGSYALSQWFVPVSGSVTNADASASVIASCHTSSTCLSGGTLSDATVTSGYSLSLPLGVWDITASMPGHDDATTTVTIGADKSVTGSTSLALSLTKALIAVKFGLSGNSAPSSGSWSLSAVTCTAGYCETQAPVLPSLPVIFTGSPTPTATLGNGTSKYLTLGTYDFTFQTGAVTLTCSYTVTGSASPTVTYNAYTSPPGVCQLS